MTPEPSELQLSQAHSRFRDAHMQAILKDWRDRMSGQRSDLLSYDEVRQVLRAQEMGVRPSLQDVPLDKIVGSVGRYRDFNGAFLPRNEALEERWARVDAMREGMEGLPPVDLLKIGDVYFVRDGNHRVSVARAHGEKSIEAFVTPVETAAPVNAQSAEELRQAIIEAGRQQFLKRTGLGKTHPEADIRLTEPGNYKELEDHIAVHRWYMGEKRGEEVPYEEAAQSWYENVYLPLAREIEKSGILEEFPGRTATDLYLWLCRHREALKDKYNLHLDEKATVSTFASVYSGTPLRRKIKSLRLRLARLWAKLTGKDQIILGLPKSSEEEDTAPAEETNDNDLSG